MKRSLKDISPGLIVTILGMVIRPLIPWLREQAKKTDSPIDDWMIDLLEIFFPA